MMWTLLRALLFLLILPGGAHVYVKVMNIGHDTFQIVGTAAFSGDNVSKIRWMAVGI